ncbi:MAG: PD-(D/E)XK motif protein, partial [Bacteroidia bacterium]|nr:PD-(D/E)XK motif protein [Bacteroidia bacterium]
SEYYGRMYSLKKTFAFSVTSEFPKIIKSQLPLGIYDTSYSIEISSIENFIVDINDILKKI